MGLPRVRDVRPVTNPLSDDALIAKLNMIAAEIRHEDDLIGQRMSWLVV